MRPFFATILGFFRSCSSSSRFGSRARKASHLPSGDQTGSDTPCLRLVIRFASPPPTGMTQICGFALSSSFSGARKAMRVPSGDHRGEPSRWNRFVNCTRLRPFVAMSQMSDRWRSFSRFACEITQATHLPSGDIWGMAMLRSR